MPVLRRRSLPIWGGQKVDELRRYGLWPVRTGEVRRVIDSAPSKPAPLGSAIIALGDGFLMQWRLDPDHTPDGAELVTALGEAIALGRGVPAR